MRSGINMDVDIDEEQFLNFHSCRAPDISHRSCILYPKLQDCSIESIHADVSQLGKPLNDEFMDEAHLSVNFLKVSQSSVDSGVFSEPSVDSPSSDLDCRGSFPSLLASSPCKRHASPIAIRSLKYFCGSPDKSSSKRSYFHTFQSTPRSPKHRRQKYSRDIFLKRNSISDEETRPWNVSLVGQKTVDFLAHLGQHSCFQPALDAILGYLNSEDLCRASSVSLCWKNIIESVPSSRNRKKEFLLQQAQLKENLHQNGKKSDVCEIMPLRGQPLATQNFNFTVDHSQLSSRSPPVSPSKIRFNLYFKEGQKLENGQALVQCPHCKLPSRRKTEQSALCTRRGCQFHFCVQCLCKFHGDKPCPVSVKHRKRQVAIGSRESRRNLLRLCQ